ncbi:L-rhamnose mutarotase, partial [Salmonella enterica subsp. enterica serovar Typhimurium]|nr:L-rhamnose mutarotase [Salmonella enterica subsp. enterica serovar Kentucky]MZF72312.1 L-rhamnose mutarotase [Salmonella enterica subsp. enterica serovar Typhimurium]
RAYGFIFCRPDKAVTPPSGNFNSAPLPG